MLFIKQTNSVNAILAAFTKTINDLEQLSEAKLEEAMDQKDIINEAIAKEKAAKEESARALAISNKLINLIQE